MDSLGRDELLEPVYRRVHGILTEARSRAWRAVNTAMVAAYWEVGRAIVEEEQKGADRAGYGKQIIDDLSSRLSNEFGGGFSTTNLKQTRKFYLEFPIRQALSDELTWSHYLLLMRVGNDLKTGDLTHQDLGQMQMYVNYFQRERMVEGENPPIGIVLCASKSEAVVRYTLPEGVTRKFASRYQLHLPTEEELAREIQREHENIERVQGLAAAADAVAGEDGEKDTTP